MELHEIVKASTINYRSLKNRVSWERFATEHKLPSYEEVRGLFVGWREFKQAVYQLIAITNKDFFFTPKYWDSHAKEKGLPEAKHYRALFGDWKKAQNIVHGELEPKKVKKLFLISVAKKYMEYFFVQKEWDEFANANDLPISATYKNHFESWNEAVEIITGEKIKKKRYSKEILLSVLNKNKEYLVTQETWKKYAQENKLPSINTIVKHFGSFNEVKRRLNVGKIQKRVFTQEELLKIASEHKELFHISFWNFYASTYHLPTETAFINHFGSFKAVQQLIGVVEGIYTDTTSGTIERTIEKKKKDLTKLIRDNKQIVQLIYKYWHLLDSKKMWEDFVAASSEYPTYNELLSLFTSKRQLKQVLFFYIALSNKEQFNNVQWNNFAAVNNLPLKNNYYNLYSSWEWIQLMVWGDAKESKKSYLLRIANEHIEQFTTYNNWKDYASKHSLPSASQFEFYFGSWNDVKKALGLKLNRANVV